MNIFKWLRMKWSNNLTISLFLGLGKTFTKMLFMTISGEPAVMWPCWLTVNSVSLLLRSSGDSESVQTPPGSKFIFKSNTEVNSPNHWRGILSLCEHSRFRGLLFIYTYHHEFMTERRNKHHNGTISITVCMWKVKLV